MLEAKKVRYRMACTELNVIFKFLPSREFKMVPARVRRNVKAMMDKNYDYRLDLNRPLAEQELMPETKALIVEIYERYLCTEDEKDRWEIYDKFCLDKIEERKREKYNPENVFVKENKAREDEEEEQEEMIEELALTEIGSMGFFRRIIERIKRLIGK